jgi:hypothetical protein
VTFNLNLPLAEAIDDLPVKNRSEWMNKQLPALLEAREDVADLKIDPAARIASIPDDELFLEAEKRGIVAGFSTKRRILLALQAVREDMPTKKQLITNLEKALRDA